MDVGTWGRGDATDLTPQAGICRPIHGCPAAQPFDPRAWKVTRASPKKPLPVAFKKAV
jgi:hypothetical protein